MEGIFYFGNDWKKDYKKQLGEEQFHLPSTNSMGENLFH
jgi:hypothetical protein